MASFPTNYPSGLQQLLGPMAGFNRTVVDVPVNRTFRDENSTRLSNLSFVGDTWGKFIPITWGVARVQGLIVWAAQFKEQKRELYTKKLTYPAWPPFQTTMGFYYTVSCAYSFGYNGNPNKRKFLNKLWLNDVLVYDRVGGYRYPGVQWQFYSGSLDQLPDIKYVEDKDGYAVPFRGQMYVAFHDLPLDNFGSALPRCMAEIYDDPSVPVVADDFNNTITASADHGYYPVIDWIRRKLYVNVKSATEADDFNTLAVYDLDTLNQIAEYTMGPFNPGLTFFASAGAYAFIQPLNVLILSGGTPVNVFVVDMATGYVIDKSDFFGSVFRMIASAGAGEVAAYVGFQHGISQNLGIMGVASDGSILDPIDVALGESITQIASEPLFPAFYVHGSTTRKLRRVDLFGPEPAFRDIATLDSTVSINHMFSWNNSLYVNTTDSADNESQWTRYNLETENYGAIVWRRENVAAVVIAFGSGELSQTNLEGGTFAFGSYADGGNCNVVDLNTGQIELIDVDVPLTVWDSASHAFYTGYTLNPPRRLYLRSPDVGTMLLRDWLRDVCIVGGMSPGDLTFENIDDEIDGAFISRSYDLDEILNGACALFRITKTEVDGKLRFEKKFPDEGSIEPELTIDYADLAWVDDDDDSRAAISMKRIAEVAQPSNVSVTFINPETGYIDDTYSWKRPRVSTRSQIDLSYAIPIVMSKTQVAKLVQEMLYDLWGSRMVATIRLPTKFYNIDPGTIIQLNHNGFSDIVKVTETTHEGDWSVTCFIETIRSTVGSAIEVDEYVPTLPRPQGRPESELYFFDIPAIVPEHDIDDKIVYYVSMGGVGQKYWPGGYVAQATEGTPFAAIETFQPPPFDVGRVLNTVEAANNVSDGLRVSFGAGVDPYATYPEKTLAELAAEPLLNAALYGANGRWELIQWGKSSLDSFGAVVFDRVIRGKRGTDTAISLHIAGDRFVPLDPRVTVIEEPLSIFDTEQLYKAVGYGQPIDDAVTYRVTIAANGKKPFAPVLRKLASMSGSDIEIEWFRRDRRGFSTLGTATALPMSETAELYDLELLDGAGAVVRTVAGLTAPAYTYTAAQQATDGLLGASGAIRARVYQLSAVVGRGFPGEGLIYVR